MEEIDHGVNGDFIIAKQNIVILEQHSPFA